MRKTLSILFFAGLMAAASPAFAGEIGGGVPVPEAPNVMLFAMGLVGVIVGRRAAMKREDDSEE